MQLGFWKGYGKFPLGLIVLGVVGVVILGKVRGGKDE
jgi:hypothetical protein